MVGSVAPIGNVSNWDAAWAESAGSWNVLVAATSWNESVATSPCGGDAIWRVAEIMSECWNTCMAERSTDSWSRFWSV